MSFVQEQKDLLLVQSLQKDMDIAMNELLQFYNTKKPGTESVGSDKMSDKEKSLIDNLVNSIQKSEQPLAAAMNNINIFSDKLIAKINKAQAGEINLAVFHAMLGPRCPYAEAFSKRPATYRAIQKMLGNISAVLKEPADKLNLVGHALTDIIKQIESGGFIYKGAGLTAKLKPEDLFHYSDAGRDYSNKTLKELGYTPESVIKTCVEFTGNKKPGFFKHVWNNLKTNLYSVRFIWQEVRGNDNDDADLNFSDGVAIRAYRMRIIQSINLHVGWLQCAKDLSTCLRLIDCVERAKVTGTETLNLYEVDPADIIKEETVVESDDIHIVSTEQVVEVGYETDDDGIEEIETSFKALLSYWKENVNDSAFMVGREDSNFKPSEKEKKLISNAVGSLNKAHESAKRDVEEIEKAAKIIGNKLKVVAETKPDKTKFQEMHGSSVPDLKLFEKRPILYKEINNLYKQYSNMVKEPASPNNVPGNVMTDAVKLLNDCGYKLNEEVLNSWFSLKSVFDLDAHLNNGESVKYKDLRYTPDIVMSLCVDFIGTRSQGYWRNYWIQQKNTFVGFRVIFDSIFQKTDEKIGVIKAIEIKTSRIALYSIILNYFGWGQYRRDIKTLNRMLSDVLKSSQSGTEALSVFDVIENEETVEPTVIPIETEIVNDEQEIEVAQQELMSIDPTQYPIEGMLKATKEKIINNQKVGNKALAKKFLNLHSSIKPKNEKMLRTLKNLLVRAARYQKHINITLSKDKLAKVVVPNIPSFKTMNAHMVAYNEATHCVSNTKTILKAPVTKSKDLGSVLSSALEKFEILNFDVVNIFGLEGLNARPIFDIRQYDKSTTDLTSAGYTVQDLFKCVKTIDTIASQLDEPALAFEGQTPIEEEEIFDLLNKCDYTDTVALTDIGKSRRMRFSVLQNMRSQLLVDSMTQDCAILVRILKHVYDSQR